MPHLAPATVRFLVAIDGLDAAQDGQFQIRELQSVQLATA